MKTLSVFILSALLLVLSTSCSRQVTSQNSTSKFQTASAIQNKPEIVRVPNDHTIAKIESQAALVINLEAEAQNCPDDIKPSPSLRNMDDNKKVLKNGAERVKSLVSKQLNELTFSQKSTTERGYPQINKAGFIFIAAAILGYFLHLILIACIIIGVIGLIVLLSPLFRKRY